MEREEARLTVEGARKFASALDLTLSGFMDAPSERVTDLRRTARSTRPRGLLEEVRSQDSVRKLPRGKPCRRF